MTPDPPTWAPDATVEPSRVAGCFVATVPMRHVPGVAVLTPEEIADPREIENRLAELASGRTRPLPPDCPIQAREVVGLYTDGRWHRPDRDTAIEILGADL